MVKDYRLSVYFSVCKYVSATVEFNGDSRNKYEIAYLWKDSRYGYNLAFLGFMRAPLPNEPDKDYYYGVSYKYLVGLMQYNMNFG